MIKANRQLSSVKGLTLNRIFIFFLVIFSFSNAESKIFRQWKKITIPGAFCGNGAPYQVFYDAQSSKKLAIEMMGGGACWSVKTCYGPTLTSWSYPIPNLPLYSQFSLPYESASFAHDASYLYFPYCTGDVHLGRHIEEYLPGFKVHHWGYENVLNSLKHLSEEGIISFSEYKDVILFGASAGAIGALAHAKNFDLYINKEAKRTLIADSFGLHFGNDFWKKFRAPTIRDFSFSFANMGLTIDVREGNLAKNLGNVCNHLSQWQIAFMQSTRDIVMSSIFGNITTEQHENLVLSNAGAYRQTEGHQNCYAWIPKSYMHIFLLVPTPNIEIEGVNALEFAKMVYDRTVTRNYRH